MGLQDLGEQCFSWKCHLKGKVEMMKVIILVAILSCLHNSHAARILALMNLPSPSHYIFNRALLVALAERGHQVTVISADQEKKPVANLTNILLEDIYTNLAEDISYENLAYYNIIDMAYLTFDWGTMMCKKQCLTKGFQELLNYPSDTKFDLIITEVAWGECLLGFIHKFGYPPVIATSGVGIPPWLTLTTANPENPSYIPNFLLEYTEHMSFVERLQNFLVLNLLHSLYQFRYLPEQWQLSSKYFGQDLPPLIDIIRNFSIIMVNTNYGLDVSRPLLPNIIPIGGMHIKSKPDPLPKDLKKFLDEAKDGFIFFSLGSNLRSADLSENKKNALLEAFSELSQRVVWKFESDNLEGFPSNVLVSKWLPQSSILAHPNIRLFISHCGRMSILEATYWGIPVVGVPFFLDQSVNLKKLISRGAAVGLDYKTLSKENVLKAVRTIIDNSSYSVTMKKLSSVYRDEPQSALDRAVFWTEYVLRHGGAPYLRSVSADLYWYQYLLLDVIFTLAAALLIILLLAFLILRVIFRIVMRLTSGSPKKVKTK